MIFDSSLKCEIAKVWNDELKKNENENENEM